MASGENSLSAFHNVLQELSAWLRASSVEGVVIGGVAVVLLGRPRMTRDVDMLVWLDDEQLPAFLAEGQRRGFSSRFTNPLEFAKKSHIVSVRHALSQITVDIALGALAFSWS